MQGIHSVQNVRQTGEVSTQISAAFNITQVSVVTNTPLFPSIQQLTQTLPSSTLSIGLIKQTRCGQLISSPWASRDQWTWTLTLVKNV